MSWYEMIVLALIQALTEFLPISSSAHLALAGMFFGWNYQGIVMDLALHFGTLFAVLIYFRSTLWEIAKAVINIRPGQTLDRHQRLGMGMIVATIPAAIVGVLLSDEQATQLRHPLLIAFNMVVFGLLLGWSDRRKNVPRHSDSLSIKHFLTLGLMQSLALVPGVSRSGITMTSALWMGLDRIDAARLSFLISVPITFLAAAHGLKEVLQGGGSIPLATFMTGAAFSAFFALIVIHFFLRFVQKIGVIPFVVYRAVFAIVVVFVYSQTVRG